jgi:glycosyltransferase involved in cell wall biosynthesis
LLYFDWYSRAAQAARAWGAEAYHAHDLNTLPVAVWLARQTGGRVVYDAHELFHEMSTLSRLERRVWQLVERLLIGRADTVITVNASIAGELRERYGIPAPLVVHNAPPAAEIVGEPAALRRAAGLDPTDPRPIVLFHGGFTPFRGLEELVRASELSVRYVLILLGDGKVRPELQALTRERALTDRVRFLAPVAYDEMLRLAASADVGVIPYRAVGLNNFYATPNKLFEYMQAGLAVAASPLPELQRVIERYEIGSVFESVEPAAIAATLEAILADPARLELMRRNAHQTSRHFTWESESIALTKSYE